MASADPDGLESTALVVQGQKILPVQHLRMLRYRRISMGNSHTTSPMPDYSLGEQFGPLGGIVAIVAGTILAFLIVLGLIYGIKIAGKATK